MISISNIVSIGAKKAFKTIWQMLNIKYLYHLLYPYIAADFRHQMDCSACVKIINAHTHVVTCPQCGYLISQAPSLPIIVSPALGTGLINVDPVSKLPAKVGVLPSVQPFDPTNVMNIGQLNIGIATAGKEEMEEITTTTTEDSKWFS